MKQDTICPICNQQAKEIEYHDPNKRLFICDCIPQIKSYCDTYFCIVNNRWQVISFFISTNKIHFHYEKGWDLYTTEDNEEVYLAEGKAYLTPVEAYKLVQRYEKLLVFS